MHNNILLTPDCIVHVEQQWLREYTKTHVCLCLVNTEIKGGKNTYFNIIIQICACVYSTQKQNGGNTCMSYTHINIAVERWAKLQGKDYLYSL